MDASSQEDNRRLRTEVATLHEELSRVEANHQEKYRNAVKKSQDVLTDIKDNEFRLVGTITKASTHSLNSVSTDNKVQAGAAS